MGVPHYDSDSSDIVQEAGIISSAQIQQLIQTINSRLEGTTAVTDDEIHTHAGMAVRTLIENSGGNPKIVNSAFDLLRAIADSVPDNEHLYDMYDKLLKVYVPPSHLQRHQVEVKVTLPLSKRFHELWYDEGNENAANAFWDTVSQIVKVDDDDENDYIAVCAECGRILPTAVLRLIRGGHFNEYSHDCDGDALHPPFLTTTTNRLIQSIPALEELLQRPLEDWM